MKITGAARLAPLLFMISLSSYHVIPGEKFEAHVPPGALRGKTPGGKSEAHVPPGALRGKIPGGKSEAHVPPRGKLGGLSSFILEIWARAEAWHATRTHAKQRARSRPPREKNLLLCLLRAALHLFYIFPI